VIRAASDRIVYKMINKLDDLGADSRVLDMGAGYGGAMRKLVKAAGAEAVCLNISETQNDYNRAKIREAGLGDRITVRHGVFEDVPEPDASFDVVWSQDAFLHSDQRAKIMSEAFRVLKPGGTLIFTDPMQADEVAPGALQAVYDRLQLNDLGSMRFYRHTAETVGFELVEQEDLLHNLRTHYARVLEDLQANETTLRDAGASLAYLTRMETGLQNWVRAADDGQLALANCRWITFRRYYMRFQNRIHAPHMPGQHARKCHGHRTDATS